MTRTEAQIIYIVEYIARDFYGYERFETTDHVYSDPDKALQYAAEMEEKWNATPPVKNTVYVMTVAKYARIPF